MRNHRMEALFKVVIAGALVVGGSPASGDPRGRSTDECIQMEKRLSALDHQQMEINTKMNNEASGRGVSRQPGIGPAYLALEKERGKLTEEKNRLEARWVQVCR